jgi:hypothetical protein
VCGYVRWMPVLYLRTKFDDLVISRKKTQTRRGRKPLKVIEWVNNVTRERDVHITTMNKGIADARMVVLFTSVEEEAFGDITLTGIRNEGDLDSMTAADFYQNGICSAEFKDLIKKYGRFYDLVMFWHER